MSDTSGMQMDLSEIASFKSLIHLTKSPVTSVALAKNVCKRSHFPEYLKQSSSCFTSVGETKSNKVENHVGQISVLVNTESCNGPVPLVDARWLSVRSDANTFCAFVDTRLHSHALSFTFGIFFIWTVQRQGGW